jgi:hypothetical protein
METSTNRLSLLNNHFQQSLQSQLATKRAPTDDGKLRQCYALVWASMKMDEYIGEKAKT